MSRFLVVLSALSAACESIEPHTECPLVRGLPDGGTTYLLKSDAIVKSSANQDIISFGSPSCEDQVCVRDSTFRDVDDGGVAEGYCSSACAPNSSGECPRLSSCRALILDEATLAAIKAADPDRYRNIFGMTTSPYFCARSRTE